MLELSFPSSEMVEAAAEAVAKILRAHPHVYSHSLRYLPEAAIAKLAQQAARVALFSAWVAPRGGNTLPLMRQMRERAAELHRAAERAEPTGRRFCYHCGVPVTPRREWGKRGKPSKLACPTCGYATAPLG